jgi:hypothetical protein
MTCRLSEAGARLLLLVEQVSFLSGQRLLSVGGAAQLLRLSRERSRGGFTKVLVADSRRDLAPQPRVHRLNKLVAEGEALETAQVELGERG